MDSTLQYLTDDQGARVAVVLPIELYERLLEDLHDLSTVAKRREESSMTHEEFIAELQRDAIL